MRTGGQIPGHDVEPEDGTFLSFSAGPDSADFDGTVQLVFPGPVLADKPTELRTVDGFLFCFAHKSFPCLFLGC